MRTLSDTQPQTYQTLGRKLFINFDIKQETINDQRIQYSYWSAICDITASRAERIEAIISTQYSTAREIATINNQIDKPNEYAIYQELRTLAKQLADEYIGG